MSRDLQYKSCLPAHIAALLQPGAYPHPVARIELLQTHISYVLLAGEFVYKIKKPLDLGFLNFSTLRRRHYYCREEVRLNRRLCSDTYLGVLPVTRSGDTFRIGGSGRVVDYAVQMRRLPDERMMDRLLAEGRLQPTMVDQLADTIAAFHSASASGPAIDRYGSPQTIERNWRENFDQTRPYIGVTLTSWQERLLQEYVSAFLTRNRQLLRARVRAERIRDCHGDLRSSAVCFTDAICVFDCIEFNRRFRYSDVASEVAFLVMDLDRRGRPDLADRFARRYQRASGDDQLWLVLSFYKCYRACVRGKVNSFQLSAPEIPIESKAGAQASARRYFELACRYAASERLPRLLIMAGLSGTGKTALANVLGKELGLHVISSDAVRKQLAGLAATDHRHEAYGAGIYSREFSRKTYTAMLGQARRLLAEGHSVILDATFLQRERREQAVELARRTGALFFCIETRADTEVVRRRLLAREHDESALSDALWETYLMQAERHDPVTELDTWHHIQLDAGRPPDAVVADGLAALAERLNPAPPSEYRGQPDR
jgi:aminoglycoside phosphotransferase family enzyme/predicted kinase